MKQTLNEQLSRIKSMMNLITEQSSTNIVVTSGFTASNCDELHAFQSTKKTIQGKTITKTIGNMNVIVGDKLQELYNKGINPTVKKVTITVTGMRVDWTCEIGESTDGKAWLGFTSRGSGCGNSSVEAAELSSDKKDIGSIKQNIESTYGENSVDIEKIAVKSHNDVNNGFVQIFYRYTKPNSFPPIATTKSAPVNNQQSTQQNVTIKGTDLDDLRAKISTSTKNISIDVSSIKIDAPNFSVSYKPGSEQIKTMSFIWDDRGDLERRFEGIQAKNPTIEKIENGTIQNIQWALSIIR